MNNINKLEIYTYQELEKVKDNPEQLKSFVVEVVEAHKRSGIYQNALTAQNYYAGENEAIMKRLTVLEKYGVKDSKVIFHRLKNGEFPRLVTQLSQYLLGNGVTLEAESDTGQTVDAKELLGGGAFDNQLQLGGIQALVDGVNWGFVDLAPAPSKAKYTVYIWRATEFAPLYDEKHGNVRAGVRFHQLAADRPIYYTLYTEWGLMEFTKDGKDTTATSDWVPYKTTKRTDVLGESIVATENWGNQLPIFPLYANELKRSELTSGIKGHIDAYDFISSDLADGITHVEGIYWYIKNYGGDNAADLIKEIQQLKASVQENEAEAENWTVEYPYKAKQMALDYYKKQIRSDFMGLDTDKITGGSLTNVAIKTAEHDLGLKADKFEWQVSTFIRNILRLIGVQDVEPRFSRSSIENETEKVDNLCKMISSGQITPERAVMLNPIIPNGMKADAIEEIGAARMAGEDTLAKYERIIAQQAQDPTE